MIRSFGVVFWWWALIPTATPAQQQLDLQEILQQLDKHGEAIVVPFQVKIARYDYTVDGKKVEALTFRSLKAKDPCPGLLLIPGYSRSARDYLPMGLRFAREGFACLAVTQPGFGQSEGPADFVGPYTLKVLTVGWQRFRAEPYVDAKRLGLFGYSRGAMAAALLATRLEDVQAAVFGAGIYDLHKAYEEIQLEGIRANIRAETSLDPAALRQRSALHDMDKLRCPVLILHGEKDENAPVNQAHLLRDRLTALQKPFEIKLFPDRDHDLGRQNLNTHTLEFFQRQLLGKPAR